MRAAITPPARAWRAPPPPSGAHGETMGATLASAMPWRLAQQAAETPSTLQRLAALIKIELFKVGSSAPGQVAAAAPATAVPAVRCAAAAAAGAPAARCLAAAGRVAGAAAAAVFVVKVQAAAAGAGCSAAGHATVRPFNTVDRASGTWLLPTHEKSPPRDLLSSGIAY